MSNPCAAFSVFSCAFKKRLGRLGMVAAALGLSKLRSWCSKASTQRQIQRGMQQHVAPSFGCATLSTESDWGAPDLMQLWSPGGECYCSAYDAAHCICLIVFASFLDQVLSLPCFTVQHGAPLALWTSTGIWGGDQWC